VAVASLAAAVLSGCSSAVAWHAPVSTSTSPRPVSTGVPVPQSIVTGHGMMPGVFESGFPQSTQKLTEFTQATGVKPQIAMYFSSWFEAFSTSFAHAARRQGAYVLVQMQPDNISLGSIASGQQDTYLYSYALAVRSFGYPVILSFGHEMNGNWYSWGDGHSSSASFVAAWRHVVQVFRNVGATNVTWLWTVNSTVGASTDLSQWWPGKSYVDWIGIDGYYSTSTDTFSHIFGGTLTIIRKFSDDPVLLAETAVGTTPNRESQIASLFANARAKHLLGVLWFDQAQHNGLYHQDWRLEDDPAALAAYRAAASK
jgi:mannan endo-1,4-beta-mannosidase